MREYLKIVFQNVEPVRISDDSTSQSGQTVTLRYIPGTVLRGVVVNALSQEDDFEAMKKCLLSPKIRYLNTYPTDGDYELLPYPKGFYEDKTEAEGKKALENVVVDGSFAEGNKRAAFGRFCRMDEACVYFYNVDTGPDLKIKINPGEGEKQNVFRRDMVIGNARSAGLGKCRVLSCEYTDALPYGRYLPQTGQAPTKKWTRPRLHKSLRSAC